MKKILILGAGQTGGALAESLASEDYDITVVDENAARLRELEGRLDIRTIPGHASRPDTLLAAGAEDAELLIAVTNSDEVNMVACQVCYSLYKTPLKIARIRSDKYSDQDAKDTRLDFFSQAHMPINEQINPEREVMKEIRELLEHPGALQVLDFAEGRLKLVAMRTYHDGPLVGQELRSLREHIPNVDTKVVAIYRQDRPIIPAADTVVESGDEVFFIAAADDINAVMAEMRRMQQQFKRVMIAGGGNIGLMLAQAIENQVQVKVMEFDEARAAVVAERLSSGVAIHGDATNRDLLLEQNIEEVDAFCAVTNNDEVNILSGFLAKRLGARQVVSLITKPAYVDVVQGSDIDVAVSPQLATTSSILSFVRRGDVKRVHRLRRGAAEALETIVRGDAQSSRLVGRAVGEVALPAGVTIGAIVRGESTLIAWDDVVIESNDHVILFLVDKARIRAVERLFQVALRYF